MALFKRIRIQSKIPMLYGIDIRDTAVYALALQLIAGRPAISQAMRVSLPPGVVVKRAIQEPSALINALSQLHEQQGWKRKRGKIGAVALVVPATAAITKIIPLEERLSDLEIERHLTCQLPHYLNMAPEAVYFDYEHFTSDETSSPSIRLVAVRRDEVDARVSLLQTAGWQVSAVDTEPLALERATRWSVTPQEKQQMIGVLLLTFHTAALYVISRGYLIFSRIEHYDHHLPAALQHLWQWFALTKPGAQLDKLLLSGEKSVVTELLTTTPFEIPHNQVSQHFTGPQAAHPFANYPMAADVDTTLLATYTTEYFLSYGLAVRSLDS